MRRPGISRTPVARTDPTDRLTMDQLSADRARIAEIALDESSVVRWNPKIEHERDVALFDLLECNHFALKEGPVGPYRLDLSLRDATLVMRLRCQGSDADSDCREINLLVKPLRRLIKDYFMICESYFDAIKGASPSRIEAIDMARRGLHDEGSDMLRDGLSEQVEIDHPTARRLFTLVCVLHLRG